MLVPGIIVLALYSYAPMIGVVMAFQKYRPTRGILKSKWVGWDNFQLLLSLPNTGQVIFNTVYIAILKIILGMIVPVIFALLLNEIRNVSFKRITQTLVYLPHFLSWVIIGGILINILSPSIGIVNQFLNFFGIKSMYFLGDNKLFPGTLVVTEVWKEFGYGSIIYLAALAGIDPALYEAASMDGAGRFRQTLSITLPGMMAIIVVMGTLSMGNILNAGFDQVFNLYSPQVYQSGDIIDTLVYRLGIQEAQYSLATAVGLFKSVISLMLISISYWLAYKFADYRIF
jgi:ABC-type polysaccharide transport system, permease component